MMQRVYMSGTRAPIYLELLVELRMKEYVGMLACMCVCDATCNKCVCPLYHMMRTHTHTHARKSAHVGRIEDERVRMHVYV